MPRSTQSAELSTIDFAEKMLQLHAWMLAKIPQSVHSELLHPGLWVRFDAAQQSAFPSSNPNQAAYGGSVKKFSIQWLDEVREKYARLGVQKHFFALYPCPNHEEVKEALLKNEYKRFAGTTYPALLRKAEAMPVPETTLQVRRLIPGKDKPMPSVYTYEHDLFEITYGKPGFEHFAAFDGKRVVSTAMLTVHEGLGYLGHCGTLEEFRGRGAQSALIAARVNHAAELGCTWAASETLAKLKTSLGNLKRQGFKVVYEKEMFLPK